MASNTVALYLNLGKRLLWSPVESSWCEKSGQYSCRPPRGVCKGMTIVLAISSALVMLIVDWVGSSINNNSLLLASVYGLFNIYGGLGILKLWRSPVQMERIMNSMRSLEVAMRDAGIVFGPTKNLNRVAKGSIIFIAVTAGIDLGFYYTKFYRGFYRGFQRYLPISHLILYGYSNCSYYGPDELNGCEVTIAGTIVAFCALISEALTMAHACFLNMLCLVHASVLLYFSKALLHHLKMCYGRGNYVGVNIYRVINQMLNLSEIIEEGLGFIVLWFCLALIPYFALGTAYVFRIDGYHRCLRHVINSLAFVAILLTAAEANAMMKRLGSEVIAGALGDLEAGNLHPRKLETEIKPILLMQRISCNDFGMRGMAFTVTYQFVGSIAGLVMTYSIIIYQLRGQQPNIG